MGRGSASNGAPGQTRSTSSATIGPTSTQVTFDFTVNRNNSGAYFRLRAPGQAFDFQQYTSGSKTVNIPFGRKDEIHITPGGTSGNGHIRWENNWRTM